MTVRILLVNPWITDFAAYDFWDRPVGLLYVASFLRKSGHEVRLIDCMDRFQDGHGHDILGISRHFNTGKFHSEIIDKPDVFRHVPRHYRRYGIPVPLFKRIVLDGPPPDIVLVTSLMTYWYQGAFEVIHTVRDLFPGVPVILGGIYARLCTNHAREYSGADSVVTAARPSDIIDAIKTVIGTGSSSPAPEDEFASWPQPAWDLYAHQQTASVLTTRGCPFHCTVCASHLLMDRFERRDVDDVMDELALLAERGVEDVAFSDDALLLDAGSYAVPLFERLADLGLPLRLHTPNGLHVREITPTVARLMKLAGIETVRLSLETSSDTRAAEFSDKVSRDDFRAAAAALYEAGFTSDALGAYIMAGLPGQTYEEVEDTITFAWRCGVRVNPALFSPVPGTVAFDSAVEHGMIRTGDDPLLQNNTLRTVDWFNGYPGGYQAFRNRITLENNKHVCHHTIP